MAQFYVLFLFYLFVIAIVAIESYAQHADLASPHGTPEEAPVHPADSSSGSTQQQEDTVAPRRDGGVSQDEIEEFRKDIREFDSNGDNEVDAEELRNAFANENVNPNQLYQFFKEVDIDDSGTVSMAEYISYAITLES